MNVTGKTKIYKCSRRLRKVKKTIGLVFAVMMFVAVFSNDTFAQRVYPTQRRTINARQNRQQARIYQGIRSGRLTNGEAYNLQRQQYNIYRTESRYRNSGGRFTSAERRNIQNRLNRSNRSIYREKRDRQYYTTTGADPFPRRRL